LPLLRKPKMEDSISNPEFEIVRPLYDADLAYYARARFWLNEEAVCLSLGVDPRSLQKAKREFESTHTGRQRQLAPFFRARSQLSDLVERYFHDHSARNRPPRFWIDWLREMRLPCPIELVEAVETYGGPVVDWKQRAEQAEAELETSLLRVADLEKAIVDNSVNQTGTTRQRETLLRVLIGIALEQYGYDPKKARNSAPKQISDDLALHGLSVSDDTIRKYLNEASELLSS